jgi:iron complex outermembrane receptor protein
MRIRRFVLFFVCCLIVLIAALPAAGQEESLLFMGEEGVTTPSRRPQPIDESAASVAVISRDDIKRSGALTIPDLLATVAGVEVIRLSESSAEVSIRGFNSYSSNKVLVMLDSRPLFNLADASVDWNLIPISVDDIERIEIVRGPGSAMYGENAFFGIINIITRKPGGNGGSASAGGGSPPSQRVRAGLDDGRVRATVESL